MKTAPPFNEADTAELKRLDKMLKPMNAHQLELEPKFRREFNHWYIPMFDPMGDCVINEFNFKDEKAADEAIRKVKLFLPE